MIAFDCILTNYSPDNKQFSVEEKDRHIKSLSLVKLRLSRLLFTSFYTIISVNCFKGVICVICLIHPNSKYEVHDDDYSRSLCHFRDIAFDSATARQDWRIKANT